jgi:nitrogen regulatory protein PII-like uncharacterized protein
MSAERNRQKDLVDTTDCLEAVGVFRCWKNLFFVVTLIGLLLLGACFWVLQLELVSPATARSAVTSEQDEAAMAVVVDESVQIAQVQEVVDESTAEIQEAAAQVTADANQAAAVPKEVIRKPLRLLFKLEKVHVMWTIRALDAAVIFAAVMYCLTIMFTLKISMVGRLGGINHISRAFFWSLILLVLIMPWQTALGWGLFGVTFEPGELVRRLGEYESTSVFVKGLYWFRYVGAWVIALLCLLFAQIRTGRWSKATLRRLEVI